MVGPQGHAGGAVSTEREAKLIAPLALQLPSLDGVIAGGSSRALGERHLEASYYDTAELDLARQGITLRYRTGEDGPGWTLKLPAAENGTALVRRELRFEGSPVTPPSAARDIVRAYVRSRPLVHVARLITDRSPSELRDANGKQLAELVDDSVMVYQGPRHTGGFREIEIEILTPGSDADHLLAGAIDRLVVAGCRAERPVPKLLRALGPRALEPPEVAVSDVDRRSSLGELVRHAITRSVAQILHHDAGVRLGENPEDVHQLRVGARRLRSDLSTFNSLLQADLVRTWRDELRWIGTSVGTVRDMDVLGERLRSQVQMLPKPEAIMGTSLLALLTDQADSARTSMLRALRSRRYVGLLDSLVFAAIHPPFDVEHGAAIDRSAAEAAGRFVRPAWRSLRKAVSALDDTPSDPELHRIRILSKRCRYATEAVTPVAGHRAARFAAALADVQSRLGDHQDAVVAEAWLREAAAKVPDSAIAAGELISLQRHERTRLRGEWRQDWREACAKIPSSWT